MEEMNLLSLEERRKNQLEESISNLYLFCEIKLVEFIQCLLLLPSPLRACLNSYPSFTTNCPLTDVTTSLITSD